MLGGHGEGLILVTPTAGQGCEITKWKIGHERNQLNAPLLDQMVQTITDQPDLFGDNTDKALEMFNIMIEVQKSKLVNGGEYVPPVKEVRQAAMKAKFECSKVALSMEESERYEEALRSAQTKFDHQSTYYDQLMKGVEEYAGLIGKECLSDIEIDRNDEEAMARHQNIINYIIK